MFPELIARLEKINGQVVSVDVERVARQLNDLKDWSRPLYPQSRIEASQPTLAPSVPNAPGLHSDSIRLIQQRDPQELSARKGWHYIAD